MQSIDLLNDERLPQWLRTKMALLSAEAHTLAPEASNESSAAAARLRELGKQAEDLAYVAAPYLGVEVTATNAEEVAVSTPAAPVSSATRAVEPALSTTPVIRPVQARRPAPASRIVVAFPDAYWLIAAGFTILITAAFGGALGAYLVKR